jgi:hypothetical protein
VSKFYITNGITQDGFGARLQRCFHVMCYTYELQSQGLPVEYLHTPLSYNEDTLINEDRNIGVQIRKSSTPSYNEGGHEEYLERSRLWDRALGYTGKTVYDINIGDVNMREGIQSLSKDIKQNNTSGNLYVIRYLHQEYDTGEIDINLFHKYRRYLLNSFTINKQKTDKPQIAIHIRRSDAIDIPGRYLQDEYYVNILSQLEKIKQKYDITIYSQEKGFNSEFYKEHKVILDTDEDDFNTFKKFIHADHLIVGTSSLSYAAALLNTNTVVYHFKGHAPMKDWKTVDDYIKTINT